jgi:hypothetical protein
VQEVVGPANIASVVMALAGSSFAESLGMPIDGVDSGTATVLAAK